MTDKRTETEDRIRFDFEDLMGDGDTAQPTDADEPHGGGRSRDGGAGEQCIEWCPICRGAEVLRRAVPPEMQESWEALQREALLAARTLLDRYIERQERERNRSCAVVDIPIE